MQSLIHQIEEKYKKHQVVDVRSGDTVKIHQKIREGNKVRVQIFQGLVIRVDKKNSLMARIVVRKVASGIGVEKSFLLHSPLVVKIEVIKRSKVRRNYLSYMRTRTGKSARLTGVEFDKTSVNKINDDQDDNDRKNQEPATDEKSNTSPKHEEPARDDDKGKVLEPEKDK